MKKQLLSLIILFTLIISVLPVNAAVRDEKQIRSTTNSFMKYVKTYNTNKIASPFQPKKYRKTFNIWQGNYGMSKLVRFLHKKYFSYKILKVTTKGKKAAATVEVTYYNAYLLAQDAYSDTAYSLLFSKKKISAKEAQRRINYYARKRYDSDKTHKNDIKTVKVKIPFIKRNGKWKIEKMTNPMKKFLDCETIKALKDMV